MFRNGIANKIRTQTDHIFVAIRSNFKRNR